VLIELKSGNYELRRGFASISIKQAKHADLRGDQEGE
jgi:hypothetical protein